MNHVDPRSALRSAAHALRIVSRSEPTGMASARRWSSVVLPRMVGGAGKSAKCGNWLRGSGGWANYWRSWPGGTAGASTGLCRRRPASERRDTLGLRAASRGSLGRVSAPPTLAYPDAPMLVRPRRVMSAICAGCGALGSGRTCYLGAPDPARCASPGRPRVCL